MSHGTRSALYFLMFAFAFSARAAAGPAPTSRAGIAPAHVQAELQASTLRLINTVATAVEAFAIDNRRYPGPTEGFVPVETIRKDLQPMYVRDLPASDAWGGALQYWSDGATYRIVSNGADGKADVPYEDPRAGTATLNFDGDIVFENGHFRKATGTAGK